MIATRDLEWSAGFIEGEGYFGNSKEGTVQVTVGQVQKWPLDKLQKLFGGKIYRMKARGTSQASWMWRFSGIQSAGLVMTLYTLLSPRRKEQVLSVVRKWKQHPPAPAYRNFAKYPAKKRSIVSSHYASRD